jgi:hypothetical protein
MNQYQIKRAKFNGEERRQNSGFRRSIEKSSF